MRLFTESGIKAFLFLSAFILLLSGCGGGGSAGNPGTTGNTWGIITASITAGPDIPSGADTRNTDIYQNPDCNAGTAGAVASPEPFSEHDATVKITLTAANKDVPVQDHIIEGYEIKYTTETAGAPPIQAFQAGSQTMTLKQDTELDATVVLLDMGRKIRLASDILSGKYTPQYQYVTYTAIYTFYGKDIYGNAFSTVVQTNFDAGDYNNCPAQ